MRLQQVYDGSCQIKLLPALPAARDVLAEALALGGRQLTVEIATHHCLGLLAFHRLGLLSMPDGYSPAQGARDAT
ncbi:MAG: hypothetical protein AMXMBFR13_17880 [Phycisphaerae bacterium]